MGPTLNSIRASAHQAPAAPDVGAFLQVGPPADPEHSPCHIVKHSFIDITRLIARRGKSWAVEFCCGCWVYLFRSSFCWRSSGTDQPPSELFMDRLATEPGLSLATRAAQTVEASTSAVSWGAICAGAVVAAAVSLILFALASGLGLAAVSPWPGSGASLKTFSVITAIGLIVAQWIASGVGGYITGRLRTKWTGTHTHEVFFRDTAHGFITWAFSTVIVTAIIATGITSAASSVASAAGHGAAAVAAGAASGAGQQAVGTVSDYNMDSLFRSYQPATSSPATTGQERAEAARILARSLSTGNVSADDHAYLVRLVVANTGISERDAQTRVDNVIETVKADEAKARQAADTARKASSAASIFTALSMVIGAFIACVAAALGGQLRDEHV